MLRRKKPLLSKKESNYLWAHWWVAAGNTAVNLHDATSNDDLLERLNRGLALNHIVDEFYDAIAWLETL